MNCTLCKKPIPQEVPGRFEVCDDCLRGKTKGPRVHLLLTRRWGTWHKHVARCGAGTEFEVLGTRDRTLVTCRGQCMM